MTPATKRLLAIIIRWLWHNRHLIPQAIEAATHGHAALQKWWDARRPKTAPSAAAPPPAKAATKKARAPRAKALQPKATRVRAPRKKKDAG
jgi:hypothetical protein